MSVPPNANIGPLGAGDVNGMQTIALGYVRRGWAVIPLHWILDDGRCSCANGPNPCGGHSAGKHPLRRNWTQGNRLSSADVHAIWAEESPRANIGIRTGVISGFWVLDVDPKSGGFQSLQKLQAEIGVLPTTYVVRTPSGGYHYYFSMPTGMEIRNGSNRELLRHYGPGLDVRGDGGQVVAVGSRTDQGAYTVQVDVPIAAAPEGLLALLRPHNNQVDVDAVVMEDLPTTAELESHEAHRVQNYADVTIPRVIAEYQSALPGTGNDALFRSACSVIEFAQSPWNTHTLTDVRQQLLEAARTRRATHPNGGGQSDAEFEQVWRSARNRTVGQGRALPVNPSEALAFDPFPGTGVSDPFVQPTLVVDVPAALPTLEPVTEVIAAPEAPPTERAVSTSTQVAEPNEVESTTRVDHMLALLPEEFYDRRPWLKDLRRIAYERMAGPDAVLGAWLALVSSQVPPGVRLNTSIGSAITASLYVVLAAPSGIGKTIAASVARDIYPEKIETELLATGEGIVESFWGMKRVQDPETLKFTNERAQIHTNRFFKMDEGQGLLQLEKKVGNLTGAILRSMWSGDDAGQSNASPDRKRKVMAGSYNLGVVLGMQHEVAGEILADTSLGTPQRFLWFSTADPSVTSAYSDEPFTGTLPFAPHADYVRMAAPVYLGGSTPDLDLTPMPMTLEKGIIQQLRDAHADKVSGRVTVDAHDSQKPVSVGKLALLFTYIDGANHVTDDAWDLANRVYDNSATVRDQLIDIAAENQRDEKLAIAHDKAREKQAIGRYGTEQVETIRKIFDWIACGRNTRRAITQNAKGARRAVLADVLDQMVKLNHLKEINLGNRQIRYERGATEWTP